MTGLVLDKNQIIKKWGRVFQRPVGFCYKNIIGAATSAPLEAG